MGSLVALCIALGTIPTSEIETGFIDLILSRPVPRHSVMTRTIVVCLLAIAGILLMMMAGTWIGLTSLAPNDVAWPSRELVSSLAANLGALLVCWSGIAMAIGAASRRRGAAGAIAGL